MNILRDWKFYDLRGILIIFNNLYLYHLGGVCGGLSLMKKSGFDSYELR